MVQPAPKETESWHLDKKVPLALMFTIMVQTALAVWSLAGLYSRVDQIIRTNDQQDERIHTVEQAAQAQAVSAASITQQIGAMRDTLNQMREDQRDMNGLLRQYMESKK